MLELFLPFRAPPAGRRTRIAANPDAINDTVDDIQREPASDAKSCQERETWIEPDLGAYERAEPDTGPRPETNPEAERKADSAANPRRIHHPRIGLGGPSW